MTPHLQAACPTVFTPSLTALGDRSHLLSPDINLICHIQNVVHLILNENLEDVILVGHSYAGIIIPGMADQCAAHISKLNYLDASVPESDESYADQWTESSWQATPKRSDSPEAWHRPPTSPEAMVIIDEDCATWLAARIGLYPIRTPLRNFFWLIKQQKKYLVPFSYGLLMILIWQKPLPEFEIIHSGKTFNRKLAIMRCIQP